jgi:hypothetical protein
MKTLALGAFAAVALVIALASRGETTTQTSAQNSSGIQQGMDTVDAYLQKGLTPEAHAVIAEKAHATSDWLKGIEQKAYDAAASR